MTIYTPDEIIPASGNVPKDKLREFIRQTGVANINRLKIIRIQDQAGHIGDYNSDTGSGSSDHVAFGNALDAMLADEDAVFEGNGQPLFLGTTNLGAKRISPRARFYWNGTRIYADTRPGGVYNTGGIVTLNAPQGMYHEDLILNGLTEHRITSISVSGTTATVTTADAHGYVPNQLTYLWGVEQPTGSLTTIETILSAREYNGRKVVLSVPTTTSFTFAVTAGTPTNPVVLRGRCAWTKNILFGGDGLRLFTGQYVHLNRVRFESINDAYVRYTTTTNNSTIQANPYAPVAAGFLKMTDCHAINCVQASTSFGGAYNVDITGHTYEGGKASSFKFASQLAGGGSFRYHGQVRDTVPAAFGGFDASHPNCYAGVGFVAEGVNFFDVDLLLDGVREGFNILPNRDADAIATSKTANHGHIRINARNCGDPLNRRLWNVGRIEDNSTQTSVIDGCRNITFDINVENLRGWAIRIGNNLGHMNTISGKVRTTRCLGALVMRLRNGGRSKIEVEGDGTGASTADLWVTNTVTYKVSEGMIYNGGVWRCDVTPGTNSTIGPTGTGVIATADGYTWKYIHASTGIVIDADESTSMMEEMDLDLIYRNSPVGGGVYLSKLYGASYNVVSTGNSGPGLNEQALTNCLAKNIMVHRNGSTQVNSTGLINHNYAVLDYDCANNAFNPHTIDSYQDVVINKRTIRNAASTANINLNGLRPDGITITEPAAMINCTTVQDVLNNLGYAYKHLMDKNKFNIEVPGIADAGSAGGTPGVYPGGSRLRLGSFGTTLQKGGAAAGSMTYDCKNPGIYVPNAYAAGAPPVAKRINGANTFTSGCGWAATNNTVVGCIAVYEVVNFGEAGATGNLGTEPPADTFGIVDGSTINTNAHWWLYLNNYKDLGSAGSPLWASGQTVQPGDIRSVGFALTSLTGNGTTATAVKASHGLSTGDKRYIARANGQFSTYNQTTQNFDLVTITVVDANTFIFPSLGTGTAAPSTGNTEIVCLTGCYEMVAPNTRTTGSTAPVGRGIVSGNYFLAVAGAGVKFVKVA